MDTPDPPYGLLVSRRVLLVDDEEDFTDALGNRLRYRGFEVTVACDGNQALDLQRRARIDAIVLDLVMPGMDGLETLRRLRHTNPDVQVIVLSGRATVSSAIRAMKRGAEIVLEKPADFDDLVVCIETAIAKIHEIRQHRLQRQCDGIIRHHGK